MSTTYTGDMGQIQITERRTKRGGRIIDNGTKNLRGILGPICSYCAGLGFTNSVTGGSLSCRRCEGTGIEPVNTRELQDKVDRLEMALEELKKLIIRLAEEKI